MRTPKILLAARALAVLAGLGLLAWLALRGPAPSGPREGSPAPPLELVDLGGQSASLEQYRGRVVLLDFWASWCGGCIEELPRLKSLHAAYHPLGLELLAPSLDEGGRADIAAFAREQGIPWRVFTMEPERARAYGVLGLPTKYLIGRDGIVARKYVGVPDPQELERDLRSLLERRAS